MKLVTFTESGRTRIGLLKDDKVVDLSQANPSLVTDMLALLEAGESAMQSVREAEKGEAHFGVDEVQLLAPLARPPKILAVGLNYRAHAAESGLDIPEVPMIFSKQPTSVTGPYSDVYLPQETQMLDYEGELAFVIGKRCRRVPQDMAASVIAGYCVADDVSVRNWQLRGSPPQFMIGKSWDTHCPFGPAIVTGDEVDPHNLPLRTLVNGEVRQDTNTNDLIFNCFQLVEFISTAITLEAGDLVLTGTPSGVGMARKPPVPLNVGDKVRVEIGHLGFIENEIVAEPDVAGY